MRQRRLKNLPPAVLSHGPIRRPRSNLPRQVSKNRNRLWTVASCDSFDQVHLDTSKHIKVNTHPVLTLTLQKTSKRSHIWMGRKTQISPADHFNQHACDSTRLASEWCMPWGKWVWCPRRHRKMSRCEEWTICRSRVTSRHQVTRHFDILPLQETIWRNWPFFLLTRWLSSSTWEVIVSTHLNPFYLFNHI